MLSKQNNWNKFVCPFLPSGDEDGDKDDDDRDVVYIESSIEPTPNLNLLRTKNPLRESHDDEGDVVYISSTGGSRCGFVDIFANNPWDRITIWNSFLIYRVAHKHPIALF